eukprot:5712694-Prorocentrum_lima.AAC.1
MVDATIYEGSGSREEREHPSGTSIPKAKGQEPRIWTGPTSRSFVFEKKRMKKDPIMNALATLAKKG